MLSGGERNRYALARILVSPSNFLLLDEPTNHLDMRAKDVLLEALAAFSGTVVFVSHDRYFIDRLATRVLEVEGGTVTSHEGNYEDYLRCKAAQAAPEQHDASSVPESLSFEQLLLERLLYPGDGFSRTENSSPKNGASAPAGLSPEAQHRTPSSLKAAPTEPKEKTRRLNPIKQKQMEDRCAFLEEEVPRIEAAIAHTEEQLGVYVSAAETQRLTVLAEDLRAQLSRADRRVGRADAATGRPDRWRAPLILKYHRVHDRQRRKIPLQHGPRAIRSCADYHDTEWGIPVRDSRTLWELLMLEGFRPAWPGLFVLRKRDAFRKAFRGFRPG